MTIDFHCHVGESFDGSQQSLQQLQKQMKKLGIKKAVVFPIDDRNYSREEMSVKILKASMKETWIIPFLRFDPKEMTAKRLEGLLSAGFLGVKLHPRAEKFDPLNKRFFPLYKTIEKSGKPLLIHTKSYNKKETDPVRIISLAKKFPKLKLVLAHFAYSHPAAFEYAAKNKLKNVWFETSVTPTQYYITKTGRQLGFDKIVFGSDCPYANQEIELLKIKKLPISAENKRKILGENARKLLAI